MTIEEALRALADGKKVRAECGSLVYYIKVEHGTIFYSLPEDGSGSTGFSFGTEYTYSIHEPPKPKKRYWQWKLQGRTWVRHSQYMDDDGRCSDGTRYFESREWDRMKKIKIEDDFIDVEQ